MELLFYSGIVSISDWKYTVSVGIKFSWLVPAATLFEYEHFNDTFTLSMILKRSNESA